MDANITVKTVDWSIRELLSDSKYSELFSGGTAIHGYLNTFDYHRVHAPLGGKVLEANLVSGLHYTQIEAIECAEEPKARSEEDGNYLAAFQQADPSGQLTSNSNNGTVQRTLRKRRVLAPPNEWGYQFNQSRAVVIIETKMGLVAVVPVGMAVVSSVVLSVNEGQVIGKGDELGYFQFGGSDAIVLCQKGVSVDVAIGEHCLMGSRFGRFSST
jgi:phosphatidylserine decarboxylase